MGNCCIVTQWSIKMNVKVSLTKRNIYLHLIFLNIEMSSVVEIRYEGRQTHWHDDVIKWKHFPRYWPFVRGIHRSPVNSPQKASGVELWFFSLICAWIVNRALELCKQWWGMRFETPSRSLWRHCGAISQNQQDDWLPLTWLEPRHQQTWYWSRWDWSIRGSHGNAVSVQSSLEHVMPSVCWKNENVSMDRQRIGVSPPITYGESSLAIRHPCINVSRIYC